MESFADKIVRSKPAGGDITQIYTASIQAQKVSIDMSYGGISWLKIRVKSTVCMTLNSIMIEKVRTLNIFGKLKKNIASNILRVIGMYFTYVKA